MINVTDTIKQAYEQSTTQYDKIILDNEEYVINSVDYGDDCYDEGNIFGTAIARSLDFEIDSNIDLEKKEFKYLTGVKTSVGIEWIDLGTFITQEVEPNETTGITKVNAMDYMLKSNIAYKSELDYSSGNITILQVLQEACQQAGLTLATTDFANNTFIVDSNQFDENTLIRQVIQAVAQISGTFAKIKNDDKLYLITPKKAGLTVAQVHKMLVKDLNALPVNKLIGVDPDVRIKMSDYSELVCKRNTHPINLVSLGMSGVEGENVVMRDEESIAEDGENSLVINDNPFAYTEAKRQQLITALFNKVKGFEYTSFEITGQSKPFLETGDEILVVDKDNTFLSSFLFRFNCKSPNGLESEMSAPSLTKATVEYQNIASAEQIAKRTELKVDKQEQTITGIIEQNGEFEEKITKVEQDINSITQTVRKVETDLEDNYSTTEETKSLVEQTADSWKSTINKNISSANILLNADFNSAGRYNVDTQNWSVELVGDVLDNISADSNGTKWLELYQQNNANYGLKLKQTINPFVANDITYTFSVYCKADGSSVAHNKPFTGNATLQIQAVLKNNAGETLATATSDSIEINNLTPDVPQGRYSLQIDIPSTENLAYIEFSLIINVSQFTQFAITKLQFEKGTVATNFNMENSEFQTGIEQTLDSISTEVSKKVNDEEFGTKVTQNWESVQIAWNQISQFIQFINAMLQIKDSNNALLMTLDRYGQKFYENAILLGIIGSTFYVEDNSQKGLAFNLEPNGKFMTWGKKDNDNDDSYMAKMYYCAPNSFGRNEEGIYFDVPIFLSDELNLLNGTISREDGSWWPAVIINDNIKDGFVRLSRYQCSFDVEDAVYIKGYQVQTNTSDGRLKHNIKNTEINAIDRIKQLKHRQFIWNEDNKQEQIGYIAQELEQVDENYVTKNPQYDENGNVIDNLYQVNLLPILATATKAIAELEEKLEEKEKIINKQQEFLSKLAEKVGLQDEYNTFFNSPTPKMAKAKAMNIDDTVDYGTEIKRSTNFKRATPNRLIITKDGTVRKENDNESNT